MNDHYSRVLALMFYRIVDVSQKNRIENIDRNKCCKKHDLYKKNTFMKIMGCGLPYDELNIKICSKLFQNTHHT